MKTVRFIFGIHNHQPVGNFDHVFEHAYNNSYLPFINVVKQFPEISIVLHFSGCLLEWLEDHHPDFIDDIARLVKRGNIEILSGGFYEPILIMIPDRDKIGQIRKMNSYIQKRFHYQPRGLWLTERVWEAHLPKPLAEAGIDYVPVDDYHFISSGKTESELTGYFVTEEQGYPLSIFPISQTLRYSIPFKDPSETIEYLRKFSTEKGDNCIVMVDDGEKFGVWPGTYQTVFSEKWLERFFSALRENQEWLKTTTFSDVYDSHHSKGRVYLSSASYFEMSEWTLPPSMWEKFDEYVEQLKDRNRLDELKPFVKGGVWRNFLAKYPESNWMQKKMMHLSDKLNALLPELNSSNKRKAERAKNHLWRGMCNCAYWHGIFGGLYLPHLRQAIYHELITAEKLIDEIDGKSENRLLYLDIDRDGRDEIILKNKQFTLVCSPHRGGIIEEISLKDYGFNILNTLQRYKEGYHKKVLQMGKNHSSGGSIHEMVMSKEEHLERYLIYDRYPRKASVDHIIHPSVELQEFFRMHYDEMNSFIRSEYEILDRTDENGISLKNEGWIDFRRADIKKTIYLSDNEIIIDYTFSNRNESTINFRFVPEFNFALLGGNAPDRYYSLDNHKDKYPLNTVREWKDVSIIHLTTEWDGFRISLLSSGNQKIWTFPIETVSLSEAGFERVYQSSVVCPVWDLNLDPGEEKELRISMKIQKFPK